MMMDYIFFNQYFFFYTYMFFFSFSWLFFFHLVFKMRSKDKCIFTLKCFDDSVHYFKVSSKKEPEATRKVRFDDSLLFTLPASRPINLQAPPPDNGFFVTSWEVKVPPVHVVTSALTKTNTYDTNHLTFGRPPFQFAVTFVWGGKVNGRLVSHT